MPAPEYGSPPARGRRWRGERISPLLLHVTLPVTDEPLHHVRRRLDVVDECHVRGQIGMLERDRAAQPPCEIILALWRQRPFGKQRGGVRIGRVAVDRQ